MLSPDTLAPLARRKLLTAGAAGVAATLVGCSSDKPRRAAGVDKVTFLTGFNKTGQDTFMYVALDKGWFAEAGIDVDIQAGAGTDRNLATLIGGAAQFATINLAGGIMAVKRPPFPDFRIFATIYQRSVSAIAALPRAGIRSPRDLAGKKIGYSAGGVNYSIFPAYADQAGLDNNKVYWTQMAPASIRPALMAGEIDASVEIVVGRPALEAAARSIGKLGLGEQMTMLLYADVLRDVIGNAIGCTTDLARKNPGLVRRFRDAALKGLAWTIDNPDEAGKIMARHNPTYKADIAAAEVRETIPYVRTEQGALGYIDPVRVTRCIALVQGLGLVQAGVTVDRVLADELQPAR